MSNKEDIIKNFIQEDIERYLSEDSQRTLYTRFPPEPNGYLHIGHAKSICLNFGLGEQYGGQVNLRFDDTNPITEEDIYVQSIMADIKWLGFQWDKLCYSSDYFEQLYQWAKQLISSGKAYVDDQSSEEIASQKGTPTKPGQESPYRTRTVEENLQLFEQMKEREFGDGEKVLRAKIDMAHENMHMRDPVIYRICRIPHHRTGNDWCIYPMYDFAHGQGDYIEGITHSLCTLEFEVHRPLYEWFLAQLVEVNKYAPRQIEFARLNLDYTVLSKRKLIQLVEGGFVEGWDDPRLPTISGMRRRGYTPESIRRFCHRVGIAKRDNNIDISLLEHTVREQLNEIAQRVMVVLNPLKVTITNYPEGQEEQLEAINNPENPDGGVRQVPFGKHLYIEKEDFMENAPRKFFRLSEGREVRLRYAYYITCQEVIKDENGEVIELKCTYDPETKGGQSADGRKVKGTLHWVSAQHAEPIQVNQYDLLFTEQHPDNHPEKNFTEFINPESLKVIPHVYAEPFLVNETTEKYFQFERIGYYYKDDDATEGDYPVFNQTVPLRNKKMKF